ncbi:MAG: hypothetical protein M3Y74_21880 [Chloroflexota bacterium]|nr:hypothetical protein [Chloroflexota bacterium]
MNTSQTPPLAGDHLPGPLTVEKVRRFRTHVAAVHDRLRARGVDPARLPDPVEELIKARDAGNED